jgi:outer membrane cobalamin receptor
MHNSHRYLPVIAVVVVFGLIGCATSKTETSSNTDENYGGTSEVQVDDPSVTLADYLRRVSGVQVYGNGSSASVLIRGTETMGGGPGSDRTSSSPLFVLNGVKTGRDFSRISNLVNMNEVTEIRVLKGIEASSSYGMQGGNGVIEILTE